MFLVNSPLPLVSATPSSSGREVRHPDEVLLLPKLRTQFAEFLNHSSPNRLGILYLSTCVGLGYGHHESSLAAFLGSIGSVTSPDSARRRVSGLMRAGLTWTSPYTLTPGLPSPGLTYLPASPHCLRPHCGSVRPSPIMGEGIPLATALSHGRITWWYRNINRLCIDYASRPRLSSRLTLGGLAFPRNPWTSGGGVSHPSLATHAYIRTRPRSTTVSTAASPRDRRSATTPAQGRHPQLRLCT